MAAVSVYALSLALVDERAQPDAARLTCRRAAFCNALESKTGLMAARAAVPHFHLPHKMPIVCMSFFNPKGVNSRLHAGCRIGLRRFACASAHTSCVCSSQCNQTIRSQCNQTIRSTFPLLGPFPSPDQPADLRPFRLEIVFANWNTSPS